MYGAVEQVSLRIGDDMALASLDLLVRIKARFPAAFRGFDGLVVDDDGGWLPTHARPPVTMHSQALR